MLTLRPEFQTETMPGTQILLRRKDGSGVVQRKAEELLGITYPTADVRHALVSVAEASAGRPVVLLGERGRGKSHIQGVIHHAFESPEVVEAWAGSWSSQFPSDTQFAALTLRRGFIPITEVLSDQEFITLWDLIFDHHPEGQFFKGKHAQSGHPIPAKSLMLEMFESQPTALVLDELQTWYDGLHDEHGDSGKKHRQWAFNFIQILSGISKDDPDKLALIVSVRNNTTEAYRQIHRDNPVHVDFRGATAKEDRKKLVLHRLFWNRSNIPATQIEQGIGVYAAERYRLLNNHLPAVEKDRLLRETTESYPFSPELLDLLEDQILMSEAAQETRDLIRILAQLFRARGNQVAVLTPADFFVDDDSCGITSLLDSIATAGEQQKLREVAQRNLQAISESGIAAPHAREIVSALWVRSLAPGQHVGATPAELHLDITRDASVDDNTYQGELVSIVNESFNIHGEPSGDQRLWFSVPENPKTKLLASARNDRLFESERDDKGYLRSTLVHLLSAVDGITSPPSRVVVLGPDWETDPWKDQKESDLPAKWDCPMLIVVPSLCPKPDETLGSWVATHVQRNRNMVRFLLPKSDQVGLYDDSELRLHARCSLLATEWGTSYRALHTKYDGELRKSLASYFGSYALLLNWNYQSPQNCKFSVEQVTKTGADIPIAVEDSIRDNLFAPEEFEGAVLDAAENGRTMKQLLDDLREPAARPETDCIPYLGETPLYERVLRIVAGGKMALNVSGTWRCRLPEHATDEEAYNHLRTTAFKAAKDLEAVKLGTMADVGSGTVTAQPPQTPTPQPPTPTTIYQPTPGVPGQVSAGTTGAAPPLVLTPPPQFVTKATEPKTGVNLLGDVEKWQLADKPLPTVKLELANLTPKELKDLLTKLPPKLKAKLEVTLPEGT